MSTKPSHGFVMRVTRYALFFSQWISKVREKIISLLILGLTIHKEKYEGASSNSPLLFSKPLLLIIEINKFNYKINSIKIAQICFIELFDYHYKLTLHFLSPDDFIIIVVIIIVQLILSLRTICKVVLI